MLARHNLRRKKSLHAAERVKALRAAFLTTSPGYDVTRLRLVDEISVTYTRRYGRAVGGARRRQATLLHTGPNVTVGGALRVNGRLH